MGGGAGLLALLVGAFSGFSLPILLLVAAVAGIGTYAVSTYMGSGESENKENSKASAAAVFSRAQKSVAGHASSDPVKLKEALDKGVRATPGDVADGVRVPQISVANVRAQSHNVNSIG